MKRLSKEFQESIIQKTLLPGGPSIAQLAKDHGLPVTTVYGWKKKYANDSGMKKTKKWTPEKKLEAITKISSMTENEVGEFLREQGLHSTDIEQWKDEIYAALRGPGRPKKDPELSKLAVSENNLKRELRRKDKALAEMSARVILLKKSQEIFGGTEEDE